MIRDLRHKAEVPHLGRLSWIRVIDEWVKMSSPLKSLSIVGVFGPSLLSLEDRVISKTDRGEVNDRREGTGSGATHNVLYNPVSLSLRSDQDT